MASDNLNALLYATNLDISDSINNQRDPQKAISHLDDWIPFLQNSNVASLTGLGSDLQNLRDYLRNGDHVNTHAMLQRLGEQVSRIALNIHTWSDRHNGVGDQLRHLGQLLVAAAGNVKTLI